MLVGREKRSCCKQSDEQYIYMARERGMRIEERDAYMKVALLQ